jgi:hypothetical protein
LNQQSKPDKVSELLLVSVTSSGFFNKIMSLLGYGKKYFIIQADKAIITSLNIQYPESIFIEASKDVWHDSKSADKFLQSLNNEFLLHDNLGRLSSYTATLSRFLPSATIAIDKLGEESRLEREKHEAKSKRFND